MSTGQFKSPYGVVILTQERTGHILTFHPDVARYLNYLRSAVESPHHTAHSVHDESVMIHYRRIKNRKAYLAVVIKVTEYPFVLTAYIAKRPKHDTLSL